MRTLKFNIICTAVALLGWLMFLSGTVNSPVIAVLAAVLAVTLGVLGEVFIKSKKQKENPETVARIGAKSIVHYALTFAALLAAFYAFSTFCNTAYGYYSFGSGKYGYEIGFWDVGEVLPDFAYMMGRNILPLLIVIFAVFCKPVAFGAAGVVCWLNILSVNTSKVFGEYKIVAAAGNDSVRETVVYNYANTVVTATFILAAALLVLALVDLIIFRLKKPAVAGILIVLVLAGVLCSYMGYDAYTAAKTFDIEKRHTDIYVTTKEGSEEFQAEYFTNEFGDMSTACAYPGCERKIVTSGDSNCCSAHSNRCGSCNKYIDGDAMYCMGCLEDALT